MKLKKFLKLVKAHCKEENCHCDKCPFILTYLNRDGSTTTDCEIAIERSHKWNVKCICRDAKKLKKLVKK